MKSIRYKMTSLESRIKEILPDGPDVFGFLGINKESLISSLNESYRFLDALIQYNDYPEVVFMKRELADLLSSETDLIKSIVNDKEQFNIFLKQFVAIRYIIRNTYAVVKEDIDLHQASFDQLKTLTDDLIEQNSNLRNSIDKTNEAIENIKSDEEKVKEIFTQIVEMAKSIQDLRENAGNHETVINDSIPTIKEHLKNINDLNVHADVLFSDIEEKQEQINDMHDAIIMNHSKVEETIKKQGEINLTQISLQKSIDETIANANRTGMAGSFLNRKTEVKKTRLLWLIGTVLVLGGFIFYSTKYLLPIISNEPDLRIVLSKLALLTPIVWLAWFCTKQYGFTARLAEDYSYKYAISMAYEGYKKAAIEVDPEIQKELLALTIKNISDSPLRVFESRNNHGSPFHDGFISFFSRKEKPKKAKNEQSE